VDRTGCQWPTAAGKTRGPRDCLGPDSFRVHGLGSCLAAVPNCCLFATYGTPETNGLGCWDHCLGTSVKARTDSTAGSSSQMSVLAVPRLCISECARGETGGTLLA